jgi:hypothetical protein
MLYIDLPTSADVARLNAVRGDICVSIYLPTSPLGQEAGQSRIELKNLAREAMHQIEASGADKRRTAAWTEHIDDLIDDDEFWRFQATSLAILATPDTLETLRVPNTFTPSVSVSDRFHIAPLLRSTAFAQSALVLALAENGVRLVSVPEQGAAHEVRVADLPKDAASAAGKSTINDRSPSGRIHGSEGQKVRLRQYARKVHDALRGFLAGREIPLILAAVQPLAAIYRSVNTYPHLGPEGIDGSPDNLSPAELGEKVRPVIDALHRQRLDAWRAEFDARTAQDRTTTDIAVAARAATAGAIASMLIDIDSDIPGHVGDDGSVQFADEPGAGSYGIADEVAGRALSTGAKVIGVRRADIPGGAPLAAILRYPL